MTRERTTFETSDALRLDEPTALTFDDLVARSGLTAGVLRELVEYGALDPIDRGAREWMFESRVIVIARTAHRLHRDLELDSYALAVALRYVEQVENLQREVRRLRAMLGI
jgi:hypothetical protein